MTGAPVHPAPIAAPGTHARAVVRRARTSFFWAMRWLPPAKRDAMYAIYACCRETDDIADEPGCAADKRRALEAYRADIAALYAGRAPRRAAVRALAPAVAEFALDKADFDALIDGMLTDSAARVRIPDLPALEVYVDRIACAVGRLSCRVFGLPAPLQAPLSKALGSALQLTNILRDLREDAARDRIYLPANLLARAGVTGAAPGEIVNHPAVGDVCRTLASLASERFVEADRLADGCKAATMRPARIMRAAYGRLFERVEAAGFSPIPETPVTLGGFEKIVLALRYGFL